VDLSVHQEDTLLLAGANGSGKTTLLRIMAGLSSPTRGALQIFGIDPSQERLKSRRFISFISHSNYLYDRLTAMETLQLWSRLAGSPTSKETLLQMLEEVHLSKSGNRLVGGFSAGMRKRLTLLRIQLEQPRIVLLDEPFSALDVDGKELISQWIRNLQSQSTTVIMASHAMDRAHQLCTRGVMLDEGQIAFQGPPEEVADRMKRHR
jgi:ABC-2 type transport system ATP-binding protein